MLCGYADDIKLMATSAENLSLLFEEVRTYLAFLGLEITDKCKILVIGK